MAVEIISIGDELLRGAYPNTNAAFIARQLSQHGWKVIQQTTVPDNEQLLTKAFQEAFERASIIIATGGLGPTIDDLTRSVLARLFHCDLCFNEKVAEQLSARFGKQLSSLENQATIPSKAIPIFNGVGTAPGLILRSEKKFVICMPGIPVEMERMMAEQVLPYLQENYPPKEKLFSETLHFCALNENAIDEVLRKISIGKVEVGIYPSYGTVTVSLFAKTPKEISRIKEALLNAFPQHLFPAENGKIEEAIHSWMIEHHKTLALAESCTGGKMASQLTALPGASNYFLGSLVTYSNGVKEKILHVSEAVLKQHGAVSSETVKEMARNLLQITGADYGIAVSGIAGPTGGTKEKPVGTVFAALIEKGHEPHAWRFQISGNRAKIISTSAIRSLVALYRKIAYGIIP